MRREDTLRPVLALASEYNLLPEYSIEKQAAQRLLQHITQVPQMSVEEAAELCAVSVSTLRRFCRRLGYNSFSELRQKVAVDLASYRYRHTELPRMEGESTNTAALRILLESMRALPRTVRYDDLAAIADAMYAAEAVAFHDRMFSNLMFSLQADLSVTGKRVERARYLDQQWELLEKLRPGDVLFLVSHSASQTEDLLPQVRPAREAGAVVVGIVDNTVADSFADCSYLLTFDRPNDRLAVMVTDMIYALLFLTYRERHLKDFVYYLR